ncbi:hypothetical protein [uncultured Chitinophaga sp.]|uniref:hypothetical protein n=1 Tax=uncultured Chitinophaga sp. TaxID=339340 RepID=UPI00260E9331|nr:hypothetical protein [uncultured Chitinophaga sp.]
MLIISNLEKYREDLRKLISDGRLLDTAMKLQCYPTEVQKQLKDHFGRKYKEELKKIPVFHDKYQIWYSEAKVLIKLLLPDRLTDFTKLYEKPKTRKEIEWGNYVIEDYLQNLRVTRAGGTVEVVGTQAALPQFAQQLNILISVERRFESSLFDIKQLVQADLFDTELETAKELQKKNFIRAAGAIAGVVLEKHLKQVCENHNLTLSRGNATINNLNELLKQNNIVEVPQWRTIQFLGDIRNLCDHSTGTDPTKEQIEDLINGVNKLIKTLF